RFTPASLITRLTNDITKIQHVVMMAMRILLRSPLMLVMAVFFIVNIDVELSLILLAVLPVLVGCAWWIVRGGFRYFLQVQQKIDRLNGVVRENLLNFRVVKSFAREPFEERKFTAGSEELRISLTRAGNLFVLFFPAIQLVTNVAMLVLLWLGGVKVIGGEIRVGELIAFVNYLSQILVSLMMLSMIVTNIARAAASSGRVLEVMTAEPALKNNPSGDHRVTRGEVTFRHVHFRYPGAPDDLLCDVSFHVAAGETIAVAGATGSGKSSLVQLIPRLRDVTAGEVLVDGVDVRDHDREELLSRVAIVLQDDELFTGTILENLRWGRADASREEIERAARDAMAHDFIVGLPAGYDTPLGRGGVNLSGGQKQRLCIARALLKNPRVLILDDSTSAVDSDTELKIRHRLAARLADVTLFLITQRARVMQAADRVIVLEDGVVRDIGAPADLLVRPGAYREIYDARREIF
ncbi:MAG: ABC transporter ATP-binding protein/permease, partial [Odoribacteraceae bacterium]|nr:ABC transporter ATP-binding protein/permease [Odoribacteraceae bacterium]